MDLDRLVELLQQPRTLIGIAIVIGVLLILKKLFSRPAPQAHVITARCRHCGWTGQVSKFKPVCPKCAKPITP